MGLPGASAAAREPGHPIPRHGAEIPALSLLPVNCERRRSPPGESAWRDDVRDRHRHIFKRERAKCLAGGEGERNLILSLDRLAENFESVLLEIDDPILA